MSCMIPNFYFSVDHITPFETSYKRPPLRHDERSFNCTGNAFFFQKLLCRQRTMKIARVATLTRATRQLKKKRRKRVTRNSRSCIFVTKFGIVASPVQGRLQGRFSLRAGYAPFSKNFLHSVMMKIQGLLKVIQ